jgi:hypothetical protein
LVLLIGQPSDSRRADPFSEQLGQSMKRLSATMIPTSRILPLLRARNGWSLIDTRDTFAVRESHLGSNKESEGSLGYESKTTSVFNNLQDAGGP